MTDRIEYIEEPKQINVTYPDGETEPRFVVEAKAYAPRVKIQNDIWARPWELYNCSTCKRGRELPSNVMSTEDYHIYCRWDLHEHIGLKKVSAECKYDKWERKIERPKGGLWPGIETGPYDPDDRK